jgi:hypothetical protein
MQSLCIQNGMRESIAEAEQAEIAIVATSDADWIDPAS